MQIIIHLSKNLILFLNSLIIKIVNALFLGDFNIDLLKTNERPLFSEYLDNIISHNFFPKITLPTRFSLRRGTLIDNALCKCTANISDVTAGIVSHTLSDHHPYFITFKSIRAPPEKPKFILKKQLIQYLFKNLLMLLLKRISTI